MSDLLLLLDIEKTWYFNLFRYLFALFDWIVYNLIAFLFRAVFNLSNFELYGMFEAIEDRVFVILGIFMLFKVTISLITYLVNPDKISDKEQGASKVVTRIIVVLVMLIGLPTFFSLMTEVQNKFLPVIPRVIIGTANTLNSNDVSGVSQNMALTMVQGFAHRKEQCTGQEISDLNDFLNNINASCVDASGDDLGIYMYDYLPIISTLVGAIMCYVVFSLCINVAIRAFKLIILRSIAPIPIISYIDPKSSKDGAFASWRKMFFSTWLELFVQIGLIYFIVFAIDFMLSKDMWKGFFDGINWSFMGAVDSVLLLAFLIIGLLMFAKQAPKFIYDALGIKSTGNFMRMLGMGATAIGGIGAARSGFRARQEYDAENGGKTKLGTLKNAGASLFSGMGSVAAGGNAILSSDKPTLTTGYDAQAKNNANMLSRINAGSTLGGRLGSMGQMLIAGETGADVLERFNKNVEAFNKSLDVVNSRAEGEMIKNLNTFGSIAKGSSSFGNYKQIEAAMATAEALGHNEFEYTEYDSNGNIINAHAKMTLAHAKSNINWIKRENTSNYIEQVVSGNITDSILKSNIEDAEAKAVNLEKTGDTDLDARIFGGYDSKGKFHNGYKDSNGNYKITNRASYKDIQDAITINLNKSKRAFETASANRRGSGNKGN